MAAIEMFTDAELEEELARRSEVARLAKEAERAERAKFLDSQIDSIIALIPEHSRTSCSDEDVNNVGRCNRCTALWAKLCGWDPSYDIRITIDSVA